MQERQHDMTKITVTIDGMMCGMCESHVNEAIRKSFPVKKVTSSHSKGRTEILSENDITDEALRSALEPAGYIFVTATHEPYKKKGLFR